jgi:PAS domain S-box-containing protein
MSADRNELILNIATEGFWDWDLKTDRAYLSPRYCELIGYSPDDTIFDSHFFRAIIHPDDRDHVFEIIGEYLQGKRDISIIEYRMISKDGTVRWIEGRGKIVEFDDQSAPARMVGTIIDITERKKAEDALKEREFFFKESQRSASIGSYKADFIADNWESSEVMDNIFGIDRNYVRSVQGWMDIVHPDDRDMMCKYLREEVIAQRKPFSKEYRIIRKNDGETRWVNGLGEVKVDTDGNVVSLFGTIQDITERKRAEETITSSNKLLQTIINAAPLRIFWKDAGLRYLGCNLAFAKDAGVACPDDLIGKDDYRLGWKEQSELYRADDRRVIESGIPKLSYDEPQTTPDGDQIWLRTSKVPLRNEADETIGVLGIYEDITERKHEEEEKTKLEAQLQQAQKMESVGRLAGGVAHDFNNMLGVILGHAELALMKMDPSQPLHADLEEIRKAAIRSADLTRQLLAFARKQTVVPRLLDLNETVAGMLKMLQRLIGEDIHLNWRPGVDLWPVKVDPSQIDQIIANLCVNARDAISSVGKITIETGNSVLDEDYCAHHAGSVPGEYVLLAMSDDGCGMDKETLSHLFEPFFTTKVMGKGTGLGLAMVYGAVKQNSGFINVDSEPDQGTTFTIYLPRHEGKAEQAWTEGAGGAVQRGRETILLVEDSPTILELAMELLTRQGYTVLAASTPGEAIRLAREHAGKIDLLMTDVVMPEMNGRDLANKLLSLYPHLNRLFMSGYTADVIASHGVLDEGVNFIQKPFSMQSLAAKVREVLDSN